MKTTRLLLVALIVLACGQIARAANILWFSDNPNTNALGSSNVFSPPIYGTADDTFVTMLQGAGHNVVRYSFEDSPNVLLSAADITAINTNDLIILGRSLGSGPFMGGQGHQWNSNIVKPIIVQSSFLIRQSRLGWFAAESSFNGIPMPLTVTSPFDATNGYLFGGGSLMVGSVTASNYDIAMEQNTSQTVDAPVAGSRILATGFASNNVIVEFKAGTAVKAGTNILGGYRMYFASGNREASAIPTAGSNNLTTAGRSIFLRAVNLALSNGVPPNLGAAPTMVQQPPALTPACAGLPLGLVATADGQAPLFYQWYFSDGATFTNPVTGGTNATLSFAPLQTANAGFYALLVSNSIGTITSSVAAVSISGTGVVSTVNSSTNCPSTAATFTATTTAGSGTINYTWRKGATVVQGPTPANTFTIASVVAGDAGAYSVTVSGDCNTISNNFLLVVADAPVITAQPTSRVVPIRNGTVFSVTAITTNSTFVPLTYQWQTNGVDVTGATGSTFAISNLTLAANGMQVRVRVTDCVSTVTSTAATLTVVPVSGLSFDFNTPGQFTNAPYNLVGNDWQLGGAGTSGATAGSPFGPVSAFEVSTGGVGIATGSGSLDMAFNNGSDQTMVFTPLTFDLSLPGSVLQASAMVKIKVPITANRRALQLGFITATNGEAPPLASRSQLGGIATTAGLGFMSAILQDPVTGQAVVNPSFGLRAQWKPAAGTTATEAIPVLGTTNALDTNRWYKFVAIFSNTTQIAAGTMSVSSSLQDMGRDGLTPGAIVLAMAPQQTNIVDLVTSNRWFFAVRYFEDGGLDYMDNIYVTSQTGAVQVVSQLGNQTVLQGRNAEFRALVDGDGPYTYQWFKNGVAIPGAGNLKYRTPALKFPGDNGAVFSVTVTGPSSSVTSTGIVTVTANDLALLSVGSVEGSVIGLRFNQPLDLGTAQTPANYLVNGVAAKAARVVVNDGLQQFRTNEVLITPAAPVSGAFTVTVANVRSDSLTVIGAGNSATGAVLGLTGIDIDPKVTGAPWAAPTLPGIEYSFAPGQITVIAGGHDIFDFWDGFRFTYKQVTGDFDIKVRVPYQDMYRVAAKAGFDARVSLDPASAHVGAFANPSSPGRNFIEGGARALPNQATVSWGNQPNLYYPNAWLRFRRVGNTFIRYNSTNGVNWLCDGQVQSTGAGVMIPDTLYVGLANNANTGRVINNNAAAQQLKLSQFDNYGDFAGYSGATIAIGTQPANQTVNAGAAATFTVTATATGGGIPLSGIGEIAYVWQRTNTAVGGWTNMPTAGLTNAAFSTGTLWRSDNGALYRAILMAPGAVSVTSAVVSVTVNDTTGPTLSSSLAAPLSPNQIVLNFSEFLNAATALNAANYTVTNGFGVVVAITGVSFMNNDPRVVVITVASPLPGGTNFVRIAGVTDLNGNAINTTAAAIQSAGATTASGPQLLGPVVMEFYPAILNMGGIQELVYNPKYNKGITVPNGAPDFIFYSNVFGVHPSSATGAGFPSLGWGENYGVKMFTYFKPAQTTTYKFYTRMDDFGELWINTNAVNSMLPPDMVLAFTTNSPPAQHAWMAMDGIKTNYGNSKFLAFDGAGVGSGFYVTPAIGSTVVGGMRFWAGNDSPERDPMTFTLSGSPNSGTNGPWTVIVADQSTALLNTGGASATGRYMPSTNDILFANATAYRSYRVQFPTVRGPGQNSMQIGEVEFLGTNGVKILPSGAFLAVQTTGNNPTYNATLNSSNMTLNAGQLYYMEYRFHEGGGGDGATVAMKVGLPETDATVPTADQIIPQQFLVFPTNLAVPTPVQVETYSALATVNALTGAGGWNAAGNGSILDLLNALTLTNYIAKIPNIAGYAQHFGWNTNLQQAAGTMDNYLGRMYAYFVPPTNGLYKFYVGVDDTAQLLMNTNAANSTDPAGARLLGQIINYSGTANQNSNISGYLLRQVQGNSGVYNLLGDNITLVGGQRYYFEARWREGTGGDGIRVSVRGQNEAAPTGGPNVGADVIPASMLELATNNVRFGPIKLGGIYASVNNAPGVVTTNTLVLNEGDVVTYNAVDVYGAGSYQGSAANLSLTSTTVADQNNNLIPLSRMGLVWLKNGTDLAKNQLFAGQMFYVAQPVTYADNGGTISLIVSNTFSTATQTVTLVISQDLTPPAIQFASGSQYGDTVTLIFNENVDSLTSQSLANYSIAGLQIYWAKRDDVNRRRVVLGTSRHTPSQVYTVVANGVRDLSLAGNPTVNATKNFTAWGTGGVGGVYVELFTNMVFGTFIDYLTTSPKFIYNLPDVTYYTNNFGIGSTSFAADTGLNFYAGRVSGVFTPPSNGLYRFFVRGDDSSWVFMNTNGPDPRGATMIARNEGANSGVVGGFGSGYQSGNGLGGDTSRAGSSISPIISLTNGTGYWLEALFQEGTGGDYMEVVMRAIDNNPASPTYLQEIGGVPAAAAGNVLSGAFFSAPGNPDVIQIVATPPPTELFVTENQIVDLRLNVTSVVPASMLPFVRYQWARSNANSGTFTNIPGATSFVLSPIIPFAVPLADNNARYRITASLPGTTLIYETLFHVTADTQPPFVVSAASLDGRSVGVRFNEPINLGTGGEAGNYTITDLANNSAVNINLVTIRQSIDPATVLLDLQTPLTGDRFRIEVFDMLDRSVAGNAGNSSATGMVQFLTAQDFGIPGTTGAGAINPALPGSTFTDTNGSFDVSANGWDIWNAIDGFHFGYRPVNGNFDIKVRLASLVGADQWSKAGLMVRGSTNANSRFIMMVATPATTPIAGQVPNNFFSFQWRDADGSGTAIGNINSATNGVGDAPAYPNAWLRLQRSNSVFYGYYGTNGSNWSLLASRETIGTAGGAFPDNGVAGLATVSHDQTAPTLDNNAFAQYRQLNFPVPATITTQPGPSLVVTGIHKNVTFSGLVASGTGLRYQWRKDTVAIANATNASYTIADTKVADSGLYSVLAFTDGGGVISSDLQLIVTNALPIAGTDSLQATQNVARTVNASVLTGNDSDPEGDPLSVVAVSGRIPRIFFAANFDDGRVPPNTLAAGTAFVDITGGVANSGVVKLTPAAGNSLGSFVITNDLAGGQPVSNFTAQFKILVTGGSGNPADGFSFSFASDLPIGPITGGEEGGGTGLIVAFDNYDNGGGEAPAVDVKWAGTVIPGGHLIIPKIANPNFLDVLINLDPDGTIDVSLGGNIIYSNLPTPYVPITGGKFGLSARTGGEFEAHWVDDLTITDVTPITGAGGRVSLAAGIVTYTPANCGPDAFFYVVTDGQTNSRTIGRVNVSIVETNPAAPTITTCATNRTITLTSTNQTALPDLRPEVVATDTCGTPVITQVPAPGTTLNAGTTTTVNLIATDGGGLSRTCQVQVAVQVFNPTFITTSLRFTGGAFSGSFPTSSGRVYFIQYCDNLTTPAPPVWTQLAAPIIGDGTVKSFSDPGPFPNPRRFYRLVIQ